jgi:lipopolysaccharide export system protein LptA
MAMGGSRGKGGRVSIARLRRWLLAGVVFLLLVLAGLLGYARYKARRFLTDLPHRLGVNITSESNGVTFSQSVKGRTLFTLHAAKSIQRQDGKTTLHDVSITVYGPIGSNRKDSIKGAEFEYDQPNGVIRAVGEVHLDLAAPSQPNAPVKSDAQRIAVTTSGLVYMQKLGVGATDQPIHIVYGDLRGGAIGADYEGDTGVLRLHSAVQMAGTQNGHAIQLKAAAAEMDRNSHIGVLHTADVQSDTLRSTGDLVTLNLGAGGGIEHVHAVGHATVSGAGGVRAQSSVMDASISNPPNGASHLQVVHMTGDVQLQNANGNGSAKEAVVHFNAAGDPQLAELMHEAKLDQNGRGGAHGTLTADHVVAQLMQDAGKHTQMRESTATGNAVLRSVEPIPPSPAAKPTIASLHAPTTRTTVVSAQTLHAVTAQAGAKRYISAMDGKGDTRIEQSDDAGNQRTSSGDTLQATLRAPGKAGTKQGAAGALQSAVQTGHVVVTEHTPPAPATAPGGKPTPAQDSRATAQQAEFEGSSDRVVLTGSPLVTGPGLQLAADRVVMVQGTGNAQAEGNVRGTFVQQDAKDGSDPVHVLADHANILNARGNTGSTAQFFGGAKPARMWTATAQLDAPQVDLDRAKGLLTAISGAHSAAPAVHLLLPSSAANSTPVAAAAPATNPQTASAGQTRKATQSGPVRITGQTLTVTDATATSPGHAIMTGNVRLTSVDTQLTADTVNATLASAKSAAPAKSAAKPVAPNGVFAGNVESILATGDVHLQQPGRTGTGSRLFYTAADSRYELTGTATAPPRILDSQRGTVTGASLIFHGADDSVEVSGEPGRRVHSETQAGQPGRSR